jgi:hypothetical protein
MTNTPASLKKVPLRAFLLCLIPLLITISLGISEQKTVRELASNGVSTQAKILDSWLKKGGWRRREKYYIQYEFELDQSNGSRTKIRHTEEISRPQYWALQGATSVDIRYLPSQPKVARSETYSIDSIATITLFLVMAGALFLPGITVIFLLAAKSIGLDQWYGKYILLIPLLAYIGLLIDLLSESTLHEHKLNAFLSLIMPIGATVFLVIADLFHISNVSDLRQRK